MSQHFEVSLGWDPEDASANIDGVLGDGATTFHARLESIEDMDWDDDVVTGVQLVHDWESREGFGEGSLVVEHCGPPEDQLFYHPDSD